MPPHLFILSIHEVGDHIIFVQCYTTRQIESLPVTPLQQYVMT